MLRALTRCSLWRPARAPLAALPGWMPRAALPSSAARSSLWPAATGSLLHQSQRVRRMTTAAPAPYAMDVAQPLTEEKGILGRGHEWYPVIGLTAFAAVSQEFYIVDEYTFIGAAFFSALYSAWTALSDRWEKRVKDSWNGSVKRTKDVLGIRMDFLENYKLLEGFAQGHAADLRALHEEEKAIAKRSVEYLNLKTRVETTQLIEARLKVIASLEEDTRRRAVAALSAAAADYVTEQWTKVPAAVKNKVVTDAITQIPPTFYDRTWVWKTTQARNSPEVNVKPDDPVQLLFDQFLAQSRTPEQLGVSNSVARLLAREAQQEKEKAERAAKAAAAAAAGEKPPAAAGH